MSFEAAFFGTDCHTNVFQRRPYSLVLMTYHGVVLLMSGYQANEDKILHEYQTIVDRWESYLQVFYVLYIFRE